MKKILLFFLSSLFLTSCWAINAKPLSKDMQRLCKNADVSKFIPLSESLAAPHSDPLFHSIEMGGAASEITSLLRGRKPDQIVVDGMTPLVVAAVTNNWPAAKALIDLGANINFTQEPDVPLTPLEAALSNSNYSFACKLLENNAVLPISKSARDSLFSTALLAYNKNREKEGAVFVEYLLFNGFDPNDKGSTRETPLMGAVAVNNTPLTTVLLKNGARLDIVKDGDRTVWGVATKNNNPHILRLLKDAQKKSAQR